jgi:hypothetical protein
MATITVGGIDAEVWCDGYRMGNDILGGGPWREILYTLPWNDAAPFMDKLLGVSRAGAPGGSIFWMLPHAYPGNTNIICHEVACEALGAARPDPSKVVAFEKAIVSATYRVPKYDYAGTDAQNAFGNQPVPWARDEMRGYAHNYPIPASALVDKDDATQVPSKKFDLLVPHIEYRRTRFQVPYLFVDTMAGLVGKVNSSAMWGRDTGTIRFDSWDTGREITTDGSTVQEYVLSLIWRPIDWNKELRDDKIQWDVMWDGTNYPYPYSDLSPLFFS